MVAIEEELSGRLDIPVFHNDQHGTAIVVMAALQNALKVVEKKLPELRIVISRRGSGRDRRRQAAPLGGRRRIALCDRGGAIVAGNAYPNNPVKQWLAEHTNPDRLRGRLGDVIAGADVFIGVSAAGVLGVEDLKKMAPRRSSSPWPTPIPEIDPDLARHTRRWWQPGGRIIRTRSTTCFVFPASFAGCWTSRASRVWMP